MIHTGWVFKEKVKIEECLVHDFGKLLDLAELRGELNAKLAASAAAAAAAGGPPGGAFAANWGVVSQWKVTSRYEAKTEAQARELYAAITDSPDGVLPWIRTFW